jgi:hypothetical protein
MGNQKEGEISGHVARRGRWEMCTNLGRKTGMKKDYLKCLGVNGRNWSEFVQFRIGATDEFLWTRQWIFRVNNRYDTFWPLSFWRTTCYTQFVIWLISSSGPTSPSRQVQYPEDLTAETEDRVKMVQSLHLVWRKFCSQRKDYVRLNFLLISLQCYSHEYACDWVYYESRYRLIGLKII